jgi:hypothetical protein
MRIAAGSVSGRPSPPASVSQSPQASLIVAVGSASGRCAANLWPKCAALGSSWSDGKVWPALVMRWVAGPRVSRAALLPSQLSINAWVIGVESAQIRKKGS